MKADQLLKDFMGPELRTFSGNDLSSTEITTVTDDSRKVTKGSFFFAVKGTKSDGHSFLDDVARREPAAICVEDVSRVPDDFGGLIFEAENTRKTFAKVCYKFADSPADGWINVGVTGTNGKTTVTHMIEHIFNHHGIRPGVIGTVDHHFGKTAWPTQLTTPGPSELTARLKDFERLGANALVMEVSSHALDQNRPDGIPFNIGVFTNLTRDHLDFHINMDEYFRAKSRLFTGLISESRIPKGAVINVEDNFGRKLATTLKIPVLTFGQEEANISYQITEENFSGTKAQLRFHDSEEALLLKVPCRHNLLNALAALGAGILAGIPRSDAIQFLSDFTGVRGRLESVPNHRGIHVFVDYAHTDDALKSVLTSLVKIRDHQKIKTRIITVFGCGGDRDKGKRPIMFEAASQLSDVVIATSDNPRTEDPNAILDDILKNMKKDEFNKRVFREADRRSAIGLAINTAQPGDVVLIAGKGHEDYQILGTERVHFSDREVVKEFIGEPME